VIGLLREAVFVCDQREIVRNCASAIYAGAEAALTAFKKRGLGRESPLSFIALLKFFLKAVYKRSGSVHGSLCAVAL
jgi:hypothetical protein